MHAARRTKRYHHIYANNNDTNHARNKYLIDKQSESSDLNATKETASSSNCRAKIDEAILMCTIKVLGAQHILRFDVSIDETCRVYNIERCCYLQSYLGCLEGAERAFILKHFVERYASFHYFLHDVHQAV